MITVYALTCILCNDAVDSITFAIFVNIQRILWAIRRADTTTLMLATTDYDYMDILANRVGPA